MGYFKSDVELEIKLGGIGKVKIKRLLDLRKQGVKVPEIAKRLGVSISTVYRQFASSPLEAKQKGLPARRSRPSGRRQRPRSIGLRSRLRAD